MKLFSDIIKNLQQRFFKAVTSNNLVYNTCWEDPRIDRKLLELDSQSNILMLTSAGDNALDYLLDNPQKIDSVDINLSQTALLEFKKALFEYGKFELLWDFFGTGQSKEATKTYLNQIRTKLPPQTKEYWDQNIDKFKSGFNNNGFYFSGTSGKVAHLIHSSIHKKGLTSSVEKLLQANSLEKQAYYFDEIEPQLWTPFSKWLIRRHTAMTLLGVPSSQRRMIDRQYQKGMVEFIRQSLRQVFTKLPITENYFWRVYLSGRYTRDCCPNYLQESNFDPLANRVGRINTYTSSLLNFLRKSNDTYSHFVLLDHQDWMAYAQPQKLAEEWKEIFNHARPGARILFRSAGKNIDFLPDFIFDQLSFQPQKTNKLHQKDRVGTYESTHLAIAQ